MISPNTTRCTKACNGHEETRRAMGLYYTGGAACWSMLHYSHKIHAILLLSKGLQLLSSSCPHIIISSLWKTGNLWLWRPCLRFCVVKEGSVVARCTFSAHIWVEFGRSCFLYISLACSCNWATKSSESRTLSLLGQSSEKLDWPGGGGASAASLARLVASLPPSIEERLSRAGC